MGWCQAQSFRAGLPLTALWTQPHRFTQRCARLNLLGLSPSSPVEKHPAPLISESCLEHFKLCSVSVTKSSDVCFAYEEKGARAGRLPRCLGAAWSWVWLQASQWMKDAPGLKGEELSGTWARVPVKLPKNLDHSQTEVCSRTLWKASFSFMKPTFSVRSSLCELDSFSLEMSLFLFITSLFMAYT